MAIQTLHEAIEQAEVLFGKDGRTTIVAACIQGAATIDAPGSSRNLSPDAVAEDACKTFIAVVRRFSR